MTTNSVFYVDGYKKVYNNADMLLADFNKKSVNKKRDLAFDFVKVQEYIPETCKMITYSFVLGVDLRLRLSKESEKTYRK